MKCTPIMHNNNAVGYNNNLIKYYTAESDSPQCICDHPHSIMLSFNRY